MLAAGLNHGRPLISAHDGTPGDGFSDAYGPARLPEKRASWPVLGQVTEPSCLSHQPVRQSRESAAQPAAGPEGLRNPSGAGTQYDVVPVALGCGFAFGEDGV